MFLVLVLVLVGWSFAEPYTLDVERQFASVENLPASWENRKFVQISDLQVGLWGGNVSTIRRAVRYAVEQQPAFVLLTGNFLYGQDAPSADRIQGVVNLLRPLTNAGVPTFAVLGDRDYRVQPGESAPDRQLAEALTDELARARIRVLQNESALVRIRRRGESRSEPLFVVGIGPAGAGVADPAEAFREVPSGALRVVMMNEPGTFAALPAGSAPVAVAGHTLGGQIRVPFLFPWSWPGNAAAGAAPESGWAPPSFGNEGNRLYVNRGIGMNTVPVRFNCPPEVTVFTFQRLSAK